MTTASGCNRNCWIWGWTVIRSDAIANDALEVVLRLLTPQNECVARLCLWSGLRVGDALRVRTWQVERGRFSLREEKTGKRRTITIPAKLQRQILLYSGKVYAFPGRLDEKRHRTRQAVYKDIKRAQRALRLNGSLGTHSMRKTFAVKKYASCGNLRRVQQLLNHSEECVTMLYALANELGLSDRRGAARTVGKEEPP